MWTSVDHWLGVAERELLDGTDAQETALERVAALCDRIPDEDKPWAIVHREAMGTRDALLTGVGPRLARYEQLLTRVVGGPRTAEATRVRVLMAVVATQLAGERWVRGNGIPLGVHLRDVCRELGLIDADGNTGG